MEIQTVGGRECITDNLGRRCIPECHRPLPTNLIAGVSMGPNPELCSSGTKEEALALMLNVASRQHGNKPAEYLGTDGLKDRGRI